MKTGYLFNPQTKAYQGTQEAQENPREPGVYMLPAFSTEIAPPETSEGETAYFVDGKWTVRRMGLFASPEDARAAKRMEILIKAATKMAGSTAAVMRHMEQLVANRPTTLSQAEFETLVDQREAIRTQAEAYEKEMGNTPEAIEAMNISF